MIDDFIGTTDDWLRYAEEDFGFANISLADPEINYFAQICFHYQQAAEKYLKAFVVENKLPFKKIHDLDGLREQCKTVDLQFEDLKDGCDYLSDFYIEPRYPVAWPANLTREDALKAKVIVEKIRNFVLKKLGKGTEK